MCGVQTRCMRSWWNRILEDLADYIAVYGWADPTSSTPPMWIDEPFRDDCDGDGRDPSPVEPDRALTRRS